MTSTGDFESLVQRYRPELLAHCYRMLGSVHDAEELVQETCLRAWRARGRYDPSHASLRTWLYRIATNACLTALGGLGRRPMPSGLVNESEPLPPLVHGGEATWLQPLPDSLLGPGAPATAAIDRGSLRLAFVAALQLLSPRERAALLPPHARWAADFSPATVRFIGIVELAAALGLILPALTGKAPVLTPLAATGLAVVMLLAAVTHARRKENGAMALNTVLLTLAALVAWGRFGPYGF
ncbi:sigma-70 family RNA polymerase sigma factor [Streptomyces bobili]